MSLVLIAIGLGLVAFLLFFAWALMRAAGTADTYTAEEAERGKAPPLDEEEPR